MEVIWQHPKTFIASLTLTHSWISVQVMVEGRSGSENVAEDANAAVAESWQARGRHFVRQPPAVMGGAFPRAVRAWRIRARVTAARRYRSWPATALPCLAIFVRSQVSGIFVVVAARHTVTPPTCKRSGTDRQWDTGPETYVVPD